MATNKIGIDVSKWNGNIDWKKVKDSGIDFAMIRAGYGQNMIDSCFEKNISECNKVGLPCGAYWFSYAYTTTMAKKEASYILEAVKPYKLEYPIAYDFEYDSVDYAKRNGVKITKQIATALLEAFCGEIEKAKYYCLNYSNIDYLNNYFDASVQKKYGLWLAQWNNNAEPSRTCQIWQYSEKGIVNGINGTVDMNRCYVDFPAIIKANKLNGYKEEWYDEARTWAIDKMLTDGENPNEPITKAEVWDMFYKYYRKFGG